ncbi:hypothetical protein N752_18165 [Desulforamulus aquiferis]|nr:septum formation initiator family protein [Desulforamulus aquiferis]RYD03674.1 hypothetical protein N752_18165 [Desulforamulus aquiferis]
MISTGKGKVAELKLHRENKPENNKPPRKQIGFRLVIVFLIAMVAYIAFSISSQIGRLQAMQNNVETIQSQVEELKHKNAALREELKRIKSDSYVEQVAREQLGLVKPGETLIVPTQDPSGRVRLFVPRKFLM